MLASALFGADVLVFIVSFFPTGYQFVRFFRFFFLLNMRHVMYFCNK